MKISRKRMLVLGIVSLAAVAILSKVALDSSYGRYERGICRATLMAYTANHAGDKNPEDIANKVDQDFRRDNVDVCERQPYTLHFDRQSGNFVLVLNGETIVIAAKE